MTLLARKTATCCCPTCETEWEQNSDGTWWCDPDWGRRGYDSYRRDPLEGGRDFCPVCAANTATYADHLRFITQDCQQGDFLRWVLEQDRDAEDCFRALLSPDADWLETRMADFIQDRCEEEFVEWRCGA